MKSLVGVLVILLIGLVASPAQAQQVPSSETFITNFARPGQATISVHAWGSVGRPGIWRIERQTDLIEFLSVIQVPGLGLDAPGIREQIHVTIYRNSSGKRRQVYRASVTDLLEQGASYPALADGDILEIKEKRRRTFGFQKVAQIVGTASSLALLVLTLTNNN
jgi:hypothetical protein